MCWYQLGQHVLKDDVPSRCSEFDGGISMADVLVSAALVHSQRYRSVQKQRATSKYLSDSCGGIGGFVV
jgi:hypothetical protein